jgi:hypothetical protein
VPAQCQDTISRGDFSKCICNRIDVWFQFARDLGLGVTRMEDIILVTGRDLARSWTNVAFSEDQGEEQVSFGVEVTGTSNVEWQVAHRDIRGTALNFGPSGKVSFSQFPVPRPLGLIWSYKNLPEDQCIFVRGFRVARILRIIQRLRGAAEPTQGPGRDEPGSDKQLISIPPETDVRQSI